MYQNGGSWRGTALAKDPKVDAAHPEMHFGCGNALPVNPYDEVVPIL